VSDDRSQLAEDLRGIPTLAGLPAEAIDWLAERLEARNLEPGQALVEAGSPADRMFVMFEGEVHGQRDNGMVFMLKAPQISGLLPYSRLKTYPATMRAVSVVRAATLSAEHFPEMLQRFPELGQRLVGLMADRIREITRADVQREKLMSLGKLSAGLAHELNNPAAAVRRAAENLREAVTRLREVNLRLERRSLDIEQKSRLAAFEQEWCCAAPPRPADTLELSDREQAIGDWLDRRRVDDAWTVAASLAEAGLDAARLEEFGNNFPDEALADVLRRLSASLLVARLVDEIESASSRISDLVKAIKEYSYMDQGPIQEIDIHRGLDSTLLILKHRLKHGVSVVRQYDESLPKICARASELNQVWTNLIDNAIDAMNGKGELRIRTAREPGLALVEIVDNGSGIAPEIRDRVFDPFFTTKEVGEGSGLGLDVVHRIVRGHQGDVRFESRPGETKFQVRLPLQPKGAV
jgi:signal transduction histidine kinase